MTIDKTTVFRCCFFQELIKGAENGFCTPPHSVSLPWPRTKHLQHFAFLISMRAGVCSPSLQTRHPAAELWRHIHWLRKETSVFGDGSVVTDLKHGFRRRRGRNAFGTIRKVIYNVQCWVYNVVQYRKRWSLNITALNVQRVGDRKHFSLVFDERLSTSFWCQCLQS